MALETLVIIDLGNGLSPPVRRHAISWTNDNFYSIRPLNIFFNEILIEIRIYFHSIQENKFKK